jgi:hypothetical protein
MKTCLYVLLASGITLSAVATDNYNIVWDSPSADCHGSMPLGNGDIGVNAWAQADGTIHVLISKTDTWDDNARLLKVGKVVFKFDGSPFAKQFRQELDLQTGSILFQDNIRLWVDANKPVIHLTTDLPVTAIPALWRNGRYTLPSIEVSDVHTRNPKHTPTVVEPDTLVANAPDRIMWYHHNTKSVGPREHAEIQGMTGYKREDPLLNRIFGASVIKTTTGYDIYVLTQHPSTPDQWIAGIEKLKCSPDYGAHTKWWADFWNRSWIRATSNSSDVFAPANEHPLRVGIDQRGGNAFTGEIRNAKLPESVAENFTVEAEVRAHAGATGRIFDKITPYGSDGFLLDVQPGNTLRFIIGSQQHTAKHALPEGEWTKVALRAGDDGWRVDVNGKTVLTPDGSKDAAYVSQMFALQRFVTACAGRGRYPIKFNGSIFTVPHAGSPGDADYRRWGPGYWWQNTRLPYTSMCANGDFDLQEPLWRMYADQNLPLNKYRTETYFGFKDSAYFVECTQFWGDVFLETYGWTPVEQRKDPLQQSGWHKREWVAGPELVWMMLDNYEHTGDEALLRERIIPTADAVMRFFDNYYKTNENGQLVMHPAMACETWWECTNPMPELAGLRAIAFRLLALPESTTPPASRAFWKTFLAKLPELPTRDTPTGKALAPAEKFAHKRNIENPELYAVFPFRLCSFEKDNHDLGVQALKHRWDRGNSGWRQDDIFMAYLGLTDEAEHSVVQRARRHDAGSRFPAFWGPNYDWIPDQDHGGVLMRAYQSMLMQTEARKIFLLPAWPRNWDCDFKLHAPYQTTVEGVYRNGKMELLKVMPESRREDIVVILTP